MRKLIIAAVLAFLFTGVGIQAEAQEVVVLDSLDQVYTCTLPLYNCGTEVVLDDLDKLLFYYRANEGDPVLLETVLGVLPGQEIDVAVHFPNEMDNVQCAFKAVDVRGNGSFDCAPPVWDDKVHIRISPAQCPAPVRKSAITEAIIDVDLDIIDFDK